MTRRPANVLALAVVLLASLVACGSDDEDSATTSTEPSASTSSSSTTGPEGDTTTATIFFVRAEKVAAAAAEVEPPAVAEGAVEALLAGPDDLEVGLGMTSAIPVGTELNDISISDGTATVDFSEEFASGGGSLSMQLRVAQVVDTLTSFDTVDEVDIRLDGQDVEAIGGEGVPATDLTADDVRDVTPLVLVTSPLPGQEVTTQSQLTLAGTSNTFEATVGYSVSISDGTVLDEGFTTATAGTGTWGTFQVDVELPAGTTGEVVVAAFQQNMESGGRQDVYEVPVRVT